ncbi:MAG: hypothetical protein R3292_02885 [Alcanivorax sp.]|nr:hypothetical protein [Alcanivorax sp.]
MRICKFLMVLMALALPWNAIAAIVIVTSPHSALSQVKQSQLRQLYLRGSQHLGEQKVLALDLPDNSALRDRFYQQAVGKSASQVKTFWARMIFTGRGVPPRQVGGVSDMINTLRHQPDTLGYLPEGKVPSDLKVLMRLK